MVVEFNPKAHPPDKYKLKSGEIVYGGSTIAGVDKPIMPMMLWAAGHTKAGRDFRNVTDDTAVAGNVGHFLMECYVKGNVPAFNLNPPTDENYKLGEGIFKRLQEEWDKRGFSLFQSELELVSEQHHYGGTLDLVARDNNFDLALIDIKSSKSIYGSHLVQLSGYEKLFNENYNHRIKSREIWRSGRKKNQAEVQTHQLSSEDVELYFAVFLANNQVLRAKRVLKDMGKII